MGRKYSGGRRARKGQRFNRRTKAGAVPGSLVVDPEAPKTILRVFSYGSEDCEEKTLTSVEALDALAGKRPVLWVDVVGLGDVEMLRKLGERFGLHPLALEDVVNTHQRPKAEQYPEQLYLVGREVRLGERLETEQISIFLGKGYVLSFQETAQDCFDPMRERIRKRGGRICTRGADYLAYALLDGLVDSYFPIVERFGERLAEVDDVVLEGRGKEVLPMLHDAKRDLAALRRVAWPMREALLQIVRDQNPIITDDTRLYLRDCADHTTQIMDLIETDREMCSDLMDMHLSATSYRLNEVMRVLTVIATIFIPLTFLAGVYGMNFDTKVSALNMPELHWKYGYVAFWAVCVGVAVFMLTVFKRLKWIWTGGSRESALKRDAEGSGPGVGTVGPPDRF